MKTVVAAYVPVLHQGYINFFTENVAKADGILVLGEEFIEEFMPLHREIRGMNPYVVRDLLAVLCKTEVEVLTKGNLACLRYKYVVLPDEEISRKFAAKYITFTRTARFSSVFLRWDEKSVHTQKVANCDRTSKSAFDRRMMKYARAETKKSSDWWRQVGAVAVRNKTIIFSAHGRHVPSEHTPYALGDPRDFIPAGEKSGLSSALHGEAGIVARAALEGSSLKGAHIYVTAFPCPPCAKLVAYSGFSKCFFGSGHANLDGESVMRSQGVEIVQVV